MSTSFPRMITIRQNLTRSAPFDIRNSIREQLTQKFADRIMPGARIAVGVGSRGIANLQQIVAGVVGWLKDHEAEPFIVPAMGSHGGATAEGQAGVLSDYGITEPLVGAPVRASMEVTPIGSTDDGVEVYFSSEARSADGILVVNRIKPHTDFSGKIGSGILKMIAIGLGKRMGAGNCHTAFILRGHEQVIRKVANVSLDRAPILGGVAILEDQFHETASVTILRKEEIETEEIRLFTKARQLMPSLPIDDIDLLIVDQIGKNISGAGMDPNIIGRSVYGYTSQGPSASAMSPVKIKRIFVRDLTPESHGNAAGIGLADLTTARLVRSMDRQATSINAITSRALLMAKVPVYFENDAEAISGAIASLGISDPKTARVARILDTLSLEHLQVAEAFAATLAEQGNVSALERPQDMKFDSSENLIPFARKTH